MPHQCSAGVNVHVPPQVDQLVQVFKAYAHHQRIGMCQNIFLFWHSVDEAWAEYAPLLVLLFLEDPPQY